MRRGDVVGERRVLDGLGVLSRARSQGCDVPVLILTARDAVQDRVRGLDLGADDYLVKPFVWEELAARVRALVRRRGGARESTLRGVLKCAVTTRETVDGTGDERL